MSKRLGIALSGGGVRAMLFHAGVLKFLAEKRQLENVSAISSVSGGSLFVGLVCRINDWRWPSSEDYLSYVLPKFKEILTSICLERETALILLTRPSSWRYVFSRANVLAKAIESRWDINESTKILSRLPFEWSINGTTAETGRRFRFKHDRCGDYELGYADAGNFPLCLALAASAAYPLLIGPVSIRTRSFTWRKRPQWGGSSADEQTIQLPYAHLHIMDGGIYDNLGIEPLFDIANQTLKPGVSRLLVSDAGAALAREPLGRQWQLRRLRRIVEITMDQAHALRIRPYINAAIKDPSLHYCGIGSNAFAKLEKLRPDLAKIHPPHEWLSEQETGTASLYPTDLKSASPEMFDLICRHGYETAFWNDLLRT
ncbi:MULTISPECIES: patatin-like phospholipase family protein [Burkholderia cepacia complex]|uniref:patatin-like phospholipase family protein n=1 Tax=Burkholderia cepacia complex TaxID=87882 RepID=UPI0026563761|nr:patatin-like phospholipase family protein [Burkholderia orbicola]MDN7534550.1 patatin-like phospholipase family protein [Burkholderia orbicola]